MKLKEWWKRLEYWKKGGIIGILFGLLKLPFFLLSGEILPNFIYTLLTKIPDEFICNLFKFRLGEECGFFSLYYGWLYNPIFYGITFFIMGFLWGKIKKN